MSDKAHFELPGCVNKKKTGVQLIQMNCMWNHFTVRGTVRSGILAFGIIDPYFSEDETGNEVIVTSDRYMLMVNELLLPQLRRRDTDIATFRFQQDGATAHTAR
jgi:hypothetical protein